jgi:hypothetical protein
LKPVELYHITLRPLNPEGWVPRHLATFLKVLGRRYGLICTEFRLVPPPAPDPDVAPTPRPAKKPRKAPGVDVVDVPGQRLLFPGDTEAPAAPPRPVALRRPAARAGRPRR